MDFSQNDSADGPAYLTIFIVGGLVTILASLTEVWFAPPYWLHMVLWLPMVMIGSIVFLHFAKAWMLASSYRHDHLGDSHDTF